MLDMEKRKQEIQKWFAQKLELLRTHPVFSRAVAAVLAVLILGTVSGFWLRSYYEVQNQLTGQIRTGLGTYTGETNFGVFNGSGSFAFQSGALYEGEWLDYQLEGQGKLFVPLEGTYTGMFSNSMKDGQGTFVWKNGDSYSGDWKEDAINGEGVYTFSDGSTMEGRFQNNAFWQGAYRVSNEMGEYVIQYADGEMVSAKITFSDGTKYDGGFAEGKINGDGVIQYPNGDSYAGSYLQGERAGEGTYNWNCGDTYEGNWSDDAMSGNGTYTYADGRMLSGEFANNQFLSGSYQADTDDGTYAFTIENGKPSSATIELKNGLTYSGGFSENGFDGEGKITYPSGDSYEGSFRQGLRAGEGTYQWADGSHYTGAWSADKMEGEGTYFYASSENGYKLNGTFSQGKPNGSCRYYKTEQLYYDTDWDHGVCKKVTE